MSKNDLANIVVLPVIGALGAATGTLLLQQLWLPGALFAVLSLGAAYLFWIVLPE